VDVFFETRCILVIQYIFNEYGSSSYRLMMIIRLRTRSLEGQKGRKSLPPQCKTLSGNISGFVEERAVKFASA